MNFDALKAKLSIPSLVRELLPDGKISGNEYVCASILGGKGKSFSVNLKTGVWAEFNGDQKGGDVISLYAAVKGITQGEAYLALGGEPDSIPSLIHPQHGKPSMSWCYLSRSGIPLMYIARYETSEGKTFLPWTSNNRGWHPKSLPAPRPLYGLDLLESRPAAPILLVEGEKACDAARILAPNFVVLTWPHGAKGINAVDWSPLFGHPVIVLWPDADESGIKAMSEISKILLPSCPSIKVLSPVDKPKGWDAADAIAEGFTTEGLYEWIGNTKEQVPSFSFVSESISELLAKPEPSIEWLIDSVWVDKSRGLIAGNPGVGKTWAALEMLISVAAGLPCFGKFPVKKGGVLLLEEESSVLNLARRAHTLARGRGLKDHELSNFYHITRQFIKIPTHERELIAYMKLRGIKLAVFDSLRRFHGVDENSSEKMQPILDSFARINIETSASIVLIHHLSKQQDKSKKGVFERLRGTSDLWAWRDCIIGMEGESDASEALCSFQFRDAESPKPITLKRTIEKATGAMSLTVSTPDQASDFEEKAGRMLDYLRKHQPCSKDQIIAKSGGRKTDNGMLFEVMIERGMVVAQGYKWIVPEFGGTNGNDGNE